jgi:hypothetical protein
MWKLHYNMEDLVTNRHRASHYLICKGKYFFTFRFAIIKIFETQYPTEVCQILGHQSWFTLSKKCIEMGWNLNHFKLTAHLGKAYAVLLRQQTYLYHLYTLTHWSIVYVPSPCKLVCSMSDCSWEAVALAWATTQYVIKHFKNRVLKPPFCLWNWNVLAEVWAKSSDYSTAVTGQTHIRQQTRHEANFLDCHTYGWLDILRLCALLRTA